MRKGSGVKRIFNGNGAWLIFAGCLAGLIIEATALVRLRARATLAQARLAQSESALRRMHALSPSPTIANVERCETEWASARRSLAIIGIDQDMIMKDASFAGEGAGTGQRAGAFFDLARFVDELTELCLANEIEIPDGLRFGFASHVNAAPSVDLIPLLAWQRHAIEDLMTALIASGPSRIESVRRERPVVPAGDTKRRSGAAGESVMASASGDFFVPEPEASFARHLGMDALSFRVGFVGATACLRRFLNKLAQGQAPWCVTMVDVQSAERLHTTLGRLPERSKVERPESNGREPPHVQTMASRFVVTLEWARKVTRDEGKSPP